MSSVLKDPPQQMLTVDSGRRERFSSASAVRTALWKSVQDMFAHPEKSKSEIAGTVRGLMAEQHEIEQMLTILRATPLLTRAYEAQERWVGLPFMLHHEGRLWSGTIDLGFIAADAWSIGHFLLDPIAAGQAQAMKDASPILPFLHAFVLERLTGRPVQDVTLVDVRSGEILPFSWGDEERHSLVIELARSSTVGGTAQ